MPPAPTTLNDWRIVPRGTIQRNDLILVNSQASLTVAEEKDFDIPVQKYYAVYRKE